MLVPEEILDIRIRSLKTEYVDLVFSEYVDEVVSLFATELNLQESKTTILINGVRLWLLFFLDKEELISFVSGECDLDIEEAMTVVHAIIQSLDKELVSTQVVGYASFNESSQQKFEIEELEKQVASLQNLRTMAGDMKAHEPETPTYRSSQDSLLNHDDRPRWETDQSN